MPHPVLSGFWSVFSVWSTQFAMPSLYHCGAVAKSDKALFPTTAAHQRDKASPVLSPHRLLFIEHSLNSASNRAETRAELPKEASTSMAFHVV